MTYQRTFIIPWTKPPLTLNQRLHWAEKARLTREVRSLATQLARDIPFMEAVSVELVWVVNNRRRRDADNAVLTLKALCDGLVDADVVADDTPDMMHKHMPVIRYEPGSTAHFELRITEIKE